jgi:multidrug efflux pump subunit AcrA (membrane-fusion protein)
VQAASLPEKILPGMTIDVAIIVKRKPNALVIPLRALSQGQVQRKTKSGSELIPVQIGLVDEDRVEILQSSLQEGDEVLLPKANL